MSIFLRPQRRIYLVRRQIDFFSRRCHPALPARTFTARSALCDSHFERGLPNFPAGRTPYRSRQIPCPVAPTERKDPARWIPFLERYLPSSLCQSSGDPVELGEQTEAEQCDGILQLLYQARSLVNIDLLAYLGFKLDRWQAVQAIFNKLVDYADGVRGLSPKPGELPSNIDWGQMGSFDQISGGQTQTAPLLGGPQSHSLKSFDAYSEEPIMMPRMGEYVVRHGAMTELWQSLGYFILEVAAMPPGTSARPMSYVYQFLARLHHLDFIPRHVYTRFSDKMDPDVVSRPPGMHLLSTEIMSILTEAALNAEAEAISETTGDTDNPVPVSPVSWGQRDLGYGVWLEFVLWCCVEGGFAREAAWILEQTQNRTKEWRIENFSRLTETYGPIDPNKIHQYDTWARCGTKSNVPRVDQTGRPFVGMGARVITEEVVRSVMDGLVDSVRVGVGYRGDSTPFVWTRIGFLRSILKRNKFYVSPGSVNYLIVRLIEVGGVVAEVRPQALDLLLEMAPYIMCMEELDKPVSSLPEAVRAGRSINESAVILGLYQYTLNIYASSGHTSGTLDVFEKLLGAVDPDQIHSIRETAMEKKYLIKARTVRNVTEVREQWSRPLRKRLKLPKLSAARLPPVSLRLLLDNLVSSGAYELAYWLVHMDKPGGPIIPADLYSNHALTPSLIRLAAATNNQELFHDVTKDLDFPLPTPILRATLNYRIATFDWGMVLGLLSYLRIQKLDQWDPTNLTALAAAIIKLDQPYSVLKSVFPSPEAQAQSLGVAQSLLKQILEGRFSKIPNYSEGSGKASKELIHQFRRIFESLPDPVSNVARDAKLERPADLHQPDRRVPADAFRILLPVIVETRGSVAAKQLCEKWCLDARTPHSQRIQEGGNTLLFFMNRLDRRRGGVEAHFDAPWHKRQIGKLVMPDLNIVRTVARGALAEQKALRDRPRDVGFDFVASIHAYGVLDWSLQMFEDLGLGPREIDRELDGYYTRSSEMEREGVRLLEMDFIGGD